MGMAQNSWYDHHADTLRAGIYRKPRHLPPFKAIRALATDRYVLSQCFAASDKLRSLLLRMIFAVLSMKEAVLPDPTSIKTPMVLAGPASGKTPVQTLKSIRQDINQLLNTDWPDVAAAIRAIRSAPPVLSHNDQHRITFLSHFVAASAMLQASVPNKWLPDHPYTDPGSRS